MIINLSNHPSNEWNDKQKEDAGKYGEIKDLPFPKISSQMNTDEVYALADRYFNECKVLLEPYNKSRCAIHLAGEPTFCYYLTSKLVSAGYTVITATTERIVDMKDNIKTSVFNFSQFREFKKKLPNVPPKIEALYCNTIFLYFMLFLSFITEKIILDLINFIFHEHSYNVTKTWKNIILDSFFYNPARYWILICIGVTVLYFTLFTIGRHYKIFLASTSTIRKFLGYTIGCRLISICMVISFLCQITWFIDTACPLFLGSFDNGILSCTNTFYIIIQLVVITLFMHFTLALFHVFTWITKKRIILKKERTLLVSGFSVPNSNSLDLFVKPFSDYANINTVIVLLSNKTFSSEFAGDKENKESFEGYIPLIDEIQTIKEYNNAVATFRKDKSDKNQGYKVRKIFESILEASIHKTSPTYKERTICFHFTEEVNYNKFDDIYKALSQPLKIEEKNNDRGTLINISPGTAMVAGALTAFAIKGNRQLIYCNQDELIMEESTVNVWTLNEVLKELWSEVEESSES